MLCWIYIDIFELQRSHHCTTTNIPLKTECFFHYRALIFVDEQTETHKFLFVSILMIYSNGIRYENKQKSWHSRNISPISGKGQPQWMFSKIVITDNLSRNNNLHLSEWYTELLRIQTSPTRKDIQIIPI